jgi:hypothetical protein
MAVTVTNSTFSALNTITAVTSNAATADVDALAEVFTITPTQATKSITIIIGGTGAAADGNITASFSAGNMWGAKALSVTVTKNTVKMIKIDSFKTMQNDGTIDLTLTPAATDKLLTDHAAYVKVIEELF